VATEGEHEHRWRDRIWVTMEPPSLSEIQPPTGRMTAAPTKGPIQA
jgi:hypothetical protein